MKLLTVVNLLTVLVASRRAPLTREQLCERAAISRPTFARILAALRADGAEIEPAARGSGSTPRYLISRLPYWAAPGGLNTGLPVARAPRKPAGVA